MQRRTLSAPRAPALSMQHDKKCECNFQNSTNSDIIFFYPQQFVADLPESYEEAKFAIHAAFPSIYDTKFMTFEVRKLLDKNDLFKWAGLSTHALSFLSTTMKFYCFFRCSGIDQPGRSHNLYATQEGPVGSWFASATLSRSVRGRR